MQPVDPGALTEQGGASMKDWFCFPGQACQTLERRLLGHLGRAACPTADPDSQVSHTFPHAQGEPGADLCPRKGALGKCLKGGKEGESPDSSQRGSPRG